MQSMWLARELIGQQMADIDKVVKEVTLFIAAQ